MLRNARARPACSLREEQERRIKELAAAWREEIVRTAADYEGRIGELERRLRFEVPY